MIKIITPNTDTIISLTDMKVYLKIDTDQTEEDGLITDQIKGVISEIGELYNVALLTQTVEEYYNCYQQGYLLTRGPIQSITSIEYYANDTWNTVDASKYSKDEVSTLGKIWLTESFTPDTGLNKVRVTYVAGWEDTDELPKFVFNGIRLLMRSYHCPPDLSEAYRGTAMRLLKHLKQRIHRG